MRGRKTDGRWGRRNEWLRIIIFEISPAGIGRREQEWSVQCSGRRRRGTVGRIRSGRKRGTRIQFALLQRRAWGLIRYVGVYENVEVGLLAAFPLRRIHRGL